MKIGQRPDGKWLLLNGKEVIDEFETRDEAIAALKASTVQTASEIGCKHGSKGPREVHLEFNPRFSEGHWEDGEGIRDREGRLVSPTIRWSEPYLLGAKIGNRCNDCGEIL